MRTNLTLLLLLPALAACGSGAEPPEPSRGAARPPEELPRDDEDPPGGAEHVHELPSFATADLLRPRMESRAELDPYHAPLLYLEVEGDEPAERPGALYLGRDGEPAVDGATPTVYFRDEEVSLEGDLRRLLTFVWFPETGDGRVRAQGLRILCDAGGHAALVEAWRGAQGAGRTFASQELEAAARATHGPPLAGRPHALDGETILAGIFASGPVPTGPYAYQARTTGDVVRVHCRCEPSSVATVRAQVEYELVPLGLLDALWSPEGAEEPGWPPLEESLGRLRFPGADGAL